MAEAEPTERDSVGDDGERGEDIFIDVTIEENRELFSLNQELENILDIKVAFWGGAGPELWNTGKIVIVNCQ